MATQPELNTEIRQTIGGECLVDVELSDSDCELAFKKAKRIFKQQGHDNFRRNFAAITVTTDERTYELPDTTNDVVRVIRPGNSIFSGDPIVNSAIYDEFFNSYGINSGTCCCSGGGSTSFDILSYELIKQRLEMFNKYAANDVDFDYDRFTHELTFLGTPKIAGVYFVELYSDLTDDEYRDTDWIVRWSIAEAKEILARAYRKFTSLPGPQGETNLGGDQLMQEAKEEKDQLKEEILNLVDGDIDAYYIQMG